ncbi:DUF2059 domain-containing protein [Noviherbaspirillum massiliense]|uniref:DUF2059 domain-containing protein n=1 Tax=Noviherbaspirillum massiliense TaxID=1465823 RepID=UPI0002D5587E|nr:DUF2059 domain-containing protein [Noviherbaspirillum massiliense]
MKKAAIFLMSFLVSLGSAMAQPGASLSSVEDLMHQSGIWVQVAQYEPMVQLGLTQAQNQDKQADKNDNLWAVRQAVATYYAADRLREEVKNQLAASLSQKDINSVLKWLSTDLGKRLTALEEQAGEHQPDPEQAAQAVQALSPKRRKLIDQFVKATRVGESSASVVINTTLGMTHGMSLVMSPEKKSDLQELKKTLLAQKPKMVKMFSEYSVTTFALIYESVSDRDFQKYLSFAESAAGRKYHEAVIQAIDAAMTKAATDMGREIGKGIKAAGIAGEGLVLASYPRNMACFVS